MFLTFFHIFQAFSLGFSKLFPMGTEERSAEEGASVLELLQKLGVECPWGFDGRSWNNAAWWFGMAFIFPYILGKL